MIRASMDACKLHSPTRQGPGGGCITAPDQGVLEKARSIRLVPLDESGGVTRIRVLEPVQRE